ncbi:MAG: glycoside hydrolase family protein, partial [Planctomycetota bacterium]
ILNLMDEGWFVWGCAPIYDDTNKVHVFFARWRHGGNWRKIDWKNTGQIVHAVADRPEGPYRVLEVVLEGRGRACWDGTGVINPQIHRFDGKYVLLYAGINVKMRPVVQAIGMAVSDSLNGPWKIVSDKEPLITISQRKEQFDSILCNNPALVRTPDGKFFLYYKGRSVLYEEQNKKICRKIGLAVAEQVEGPYVKYSGNPVLDHAPKDFEDPYVWYEDGRFRMLLHDLKYREHGAGLYLESTDGKQWSRPVKGYPSTRKVFGVKQRLETPILLMKDGRPRYLFNNRGGSSKDRVFSGFVWKIEDAGKSASGDRVNAPPEP